MIFKKSFYILVSVAALAINFPTTRAEDREYGAIPVAVERTQKTKGAQDLELRANVFKVWYEDTFERRTYPVYDCNQDVGDGTDGNWHDYWTAKKAEKPSALAASIKGVGVSSAQKIVDSNRYFVRKPRSWNAFQAEIEAIAKDSTLGLKNIRTNVLVENGRENAQNLGYASSTNCQWKDVTELVPVTIRHRNPIGSVKTSTSLRFEGGLLLSTEREIFNVTYDGLVIKVTPVQTVNEYLPLAEEGRNELLLKARGRLAITPDTSTIIASITNDGSTLKLKIQDRLTDELKALSQAAALQVSYKVTREATIDNNEAEGTILLNESEAVIDLKTHPVWEKGLFSSRRKTLQKGKTYYVKIQIQRLNTPAFNSEKSATLETSKIVF